MHGVGGTVPSNTLQTVRFLFFKLRIMQMETPICSIWMMEIQQVLVSSAYTLPTSRRNKRLLKLSETFPY